MNDSNFFWKFILDELATELSQEAFSTWIMPNSIESIDLNTKTLTIFSPNSTVSSFIQTVFDDKFKEILHRYTTLEFNVFYNFARNATPVSLNEEAFPGKSVNNLTNNFTFNNFVVSDGSKHVFNLAYAASTSPGDHNPIYIYGDSGLGKTHLLHAISNELKENYPHLKIKRVTSEQFLNDYLQTLASSSSKFASTRLGNEYSSVDALLIDDIQFLSGKSKLQEFFLKIINELYINQKQIVLIGDRDPNELDGFDDELISRLDSGLIADITPPDYETRMRIITEKCDGLGLSLDENIVSFIAGNVSGNIRQIEGVLKNIKLMTTDGSPTTLDMVLQIFKQRT